MRATIQKLDSVDLLALAAILVISVVYFSGLPEVPFHPDESTQIFMSADLETFFSNPSQLFWSPQPIDPSRQQYRLLDAPLARYLIGVGRLVFRSAQTFVDWDWGKTYAQNSAAGALPGTDLLLASRWGVAFLFPLSLWLAYLTGKKYGSPVMGGVFILLVSTDSVILLHTRRAMAEGGLLFSILLFTWWLSNFENRRWTLAVPLALAFCAKQSAAALIPVAILAILWTEFKNQSKYKWLKSIVWFSLVFGGIVLLLNPFLWNRPDQAIPAALAARQELLSEQVRAIRQYMPNSLMETGVDRVAGLFGNLFLTQPAFSELSNYAQDTALAEQNYLANPFNHLWGDPIPSSLVLILAVFGLCIGVYQLIKKPDRDKNLALIFLSTLLQAVGVLIIFPLPYQRYVIPILPFTLFWTGFGIDRIINEIKKNNL